MNVTPELVNAWRVVPRLIVVWFGWMATESFLWFMALENPSTAQAAFISTVAGMATGVFAFYVNSGKNKNDG